MRLNCFLILITSVLFFGCVKSEELKQLEPAKDAFEPISVRSDAEDLGNTLFNAYYFENLLERQTWINSRVRAYLEETDSVQAEYYESRILLWGDSNYEGTKADTLLIMDILGYSDYSDYSDLEAEIHKDLDSLASLLLHENLENLNLQEVSDILSVIIVEHLSDDYVAIYNDELEFRGSACNRCGGCIEGPNCNPDLFCEQFRSCRRNAWATFSGGVIGATGTGATIGGAFGGIGAGPGAAAGFSLGAIGFGLYLGAALTGCLGEYSASCRFCACP